MNKSIVFWIAIVASFSLGFGLKSAISSFDNQEVPFKKATGIGGIFFKCKDPEKVRQWYKTHLGLATNKYGTTFVWFQGADSTKKGYTQWSPFAATTKYFDPSTKDFMINYRVENLQELQKLLQRDSVTILGEMKVYNYGKFLHILDVEGNKIELWEANDEEYGKFEGGLTK